MLSEFGSVHCLISRSSPASQADRCRSVLNDQVRGDSIEFAKDEVIAQWAIDDTRLFGELYNRYFDRVYRYCAVRLGDAEAAQDTASITFTRAMLGIASFQGGLFSAWLFRIAHNVVIDHQRSIKPTVPLEFAGVALDPSDSPEVIAVRNDEARRLYCLLSQLTHDQRSVIELRLAGLNGNEIAEALGMRRNTVDVNARRAILKLRDLMAESGGAP